MGAHLPTFYSSEFGNKQAATQNQNQKRRIMWKENFQMGLSSSLKNESQGFVLNSKKTI